MDVQKPTNKSNKRQRTQQQKEPANKDLLRLQRPIYELKKSEQKDAEYVIRKLMAKKQKPQIGIMHQSPLLSKLKEFMPVLQKSNQELQQRVIQQSEKIDVQLEQCESSSSSSDSDDDESSGPKIQEIKSGKMEVEQTLSSSNSEMQHQSEESSSNFVEINFLRYPYPTPQQIAQHEQQKLAQQAKKKSESKPKKVLVQEIHSQQKQ